MPLGGPAQKERSKMCCRRSLRWLEWQGPEGMQDRGYSGVASMIQVPRQGYGEKIKVKSGGSQHRRAFKGRKT